MAKTQTPHLRLIRERDKALDKAREARRKLDARNDRFAYLRRSHD